MANAFEGFFLHPITVIAHVFSKTVGASVSFCRKGCLCFWIDRRLIRKFRWNLNHGFINHDGHGV